ncbi:MAG: hypothetical protein ABIJ56_03935 [Pseudomonadota bacterium]
MSNKKRKEKPGTGVMPRVIFVAGLLAAAAACSSQKPVAKIPKGKILLDVKPGHAYIYIDEKLKGTASMYENKPLKLPRGKHRLKLQAEEYFPEYVEIEVTDIAKKIKIEMKKMPPPIMQ